jgi:hypothetical protein
MKSKELTKLNILIDVLNANHREYYTKHIGHDFLYALDDYENSDSIVYLMDHIRNLNPKDKEYADYLKHCYVIFMELQRLVRSELEEAGNNYISLIEKSFTTKSAERGLLFDLAFLDSAKMDEFCKEVRQDKKEMLSSVILNIVEEFKHFKDDKSRKLANINSHHSDFMKRFNDLTN